jgi:hypothetical protein
MDVLSIVIIARAGDTPALRKLLAVDGTVEVFPDSESLRALEAILARPPKMLALDPSFVATGRGASLLAQLKAAPHLATIQVRVLAEEHDHTLAILAHPHMGSEPAVLKGSLPLERCGTRDARRSPMQGPVDASVNGYLSQLIDLSRAGAQLLVSTRLRPTQQVRISLRDGRTKLRCRAIVAWSTAEPYRVGVTFVEPDMDAILQLCARYGTNEE